LLPAALTPLASHLLPRPTEAVRLLRCFTGMQAASSDATARFLGRYTSAMFALVHGLHEALRPLLGCGTTMVEGRISGGGSK
jgi:hypothetical protein